MDNKITWTDKLAKPVAGFLTSTIFVILVMITFMAGIVGHLNDVFESWFLAIGFQCVVLIASVNSEILPMITISKKLNSETGKYDKNEFPAIALLMSIFMFFFIGISFGAVEAVEESRWLDFTVAILKALTTSAMELMFSYLFNARWNSDLARFKKISLLKEPEIVVEVEEDFIHDQIVETAENEEWIKESPLDSAQNDFIANTKASSGYM